MTSLWVVALLASLVVAIPTSFKRKRDPFKRIHGDPHRVDPYGKGPRVDRKDVRAVAQFIHGVIQANFDLGKRIRDGKDDQADLIGKIEDVRVKLENILKDQTIENTRLRDIATRIAALLVKGGDLESRAAGVATVTRRLEALVNDGFVFGRRDELFLQNSQQSGKIASAQSALDAAKEALVQNIQKASGTLEREIDAVEIDIENAAALVNTRHCFSDTVSINLGRDGTGEVSVPFPANFFTGRDEPTLFLSVQGVINKVNLRETKKVSGYGDEGYGKFEDERRTVGGQISGDATNKEAVIRAIDLSQGRGNAIASVFVALKACSIPPQTGALH